MGHRDSSAQFGGEGGVCSARSGTGAPAVRHPEQRTVSMSGPARALLFAVRMYQVFFSALMPSACKFYPSCSHYAAEAVRIHGARRGSWLALRRLSRCHPFTRGGVDLVPDADKPSWQANTPHFCHSEGGVRPRDLFFPWRLRKSRSLVSLGMTTKRNLSEDSEVRANREVHS
jgi:putative membrane protein insertion efficiency factor